MRSETDITHIVRSWLRTDEHDSADRVLEDVLALLDATPQRRPVWSARRIADMNAYAKFLVAAVAVAAVAIVGINLLPAGGVGGPPVTASPSPSTAPTPSAIAVGSTAPTVIFPPAGPITAGRHTMTEGGTKFSIQVPDGWSSSGANCTSCVTDDGWLQRGPETTDPGSVWAPVWNVDGVVADPCKRTPGPPAQTATEFADAVASLPGTDLVTAPEDVTVGGHPAKHVVIKVRDDIACPPGQFYMWGVGGIFRFATGLGETNRVWIVDVNGSRFWFEAETYKGASPELALEIQAMVDSIQFE
jgi:hypothetical protein